MLSEYYKVQFDAIQSQMDVFYKDIEVQQYLNGEYLLGNTKPVQFYNATLSSLKNRIRGDNRLSSIELVSKSAQSVMMNGYENSNMYNGILENIFGTNQQDYLFRVGIDFKNVTAMGFAEVKEEAISAVMGGLTVCFQRKYLFFKPSPTHR